VKRSKGLRVIRRGAVLESEMPKALAQNAPDPQPL
jgi:hypothetical protein